MPISKEEIQNIAELFFTETPEERIYQCGRMNSIMLMELEDHQDVEATPTEQQVKIKNNTDFAHHMVTTLPAEEVVEADTGPVIIDVSIQQFKKSHFENGKVDVEVESVIEIPEHVGIYTPSDDAYDLYEF